MKERLITSAGLVRAIDEIEHLKATGRRDIAERTRHAISTAANASESADYLNAREDQALLELKIARLEARLAATRVAEPDGANGVVDVGERVCLRDVSTGEKLEYELVGSFEADPSIGRVSAESPLGQAVLGRRLGEVAIVDAPKGRLRFEILEIELPVSLAVAR